jgi:hypothetical protein
VDRNAVPNPSSRDRRNAFAARREPIKPNIFSCEGVRTTVGFWRDMRRAAAHILPNLSATSRDLLIGFSSIEVGTGESMRNNNVGNIKVRSTNWNGPWHFFEGSQYASYATLEEGILHLHDFIQERYPGAYRQLLAGNPRFIATVYAQGYSTDFTAAHGEAKLRTLNQQLAIVRRLDEAGIIRNAPECDPTSQYEASQSRAAALNQRNEAEYQRRRATRLAASRRGG